MDATRRALSQPAAPMFDMAIRFGAVALLIYWSIVLIRPFVGLALWSIVLTVALYPAYKRLAILLRGRRRIAAVILTLGLICVALGPALWLAIGLMDGLQSLADTVELARLIPSPPPESVKQWPLVGGAIYEFWQLASTNLNAALAKVAPQLKPIGSAALEALANTGLSIAVLFASVVIMGFMLPRKRALTFGLRRIARRLADDRGTQFLALATDTIRAVANGVVGVAMLQTALAGIAIVAVSAPGASILVSLIFILGVVQIGPVLVTLPLVIWAWMNLTMTEALLFTAYMIPVGLLDNVLRPILLGRSLRTPTLVILIGLLGGTIANGLTGLFLGPVILGVIWELSVAWVNGPSDASDHPLVKKGIEVG